MNVVQLQHRTMILAGSGGPVRSVNNKGFVNTDDELGISDTPSSDWGR